MEELCHHTGLDADVRDFVMNHPVTQEFMAKVKDMLTFLLPHYQEEGKHRLVIAVAARRAPTGAWPLRRPLRNSCAKAAIRWT